MCQATFLDWASCQFAYLRDTTPMRRMKMYCLSFLLSSADGNSRFHFHIDIDRVSAAKSTKGLAELPVR